MIKKNIQELLTGYSVKCRCEKIKSFLWFLGLKKQTEGQTKQHEKNYVEILLIFFFLSSRLDVVILCGGLLFCLFGMKLHTLYVSNVKSARRELFK